MTTTPEPTADATLARIRTRRERLDGPAAMTTAEIDSALSDEEADLMALAQTGAIEAKARVLLELPFMAAVQPVVTPGEMAVLRSALKEMAA